MTRIALITTTVNVPRNIVGWAACLRPGDTVIVAGDRKTPHEDVRDLLAVAGVTSGTGVETHYLHPDEQHDRYRDLSEVIGWDTVGRRNLATLAALEEGAEVVLTVDDDNWPLADVTDDRVLTGTDVGDVIYATLTRDPVDHTVIRAPSGWHNACRELVPGLVWPRGFPRAVRDAHVDDVWHYGNEHGRVGVLASLWFGEPDVDALDRYRNGREVVAWEGVENVTLAPGTWCPFNSQATAFRAELAPALLYWPGVGRYDDIWASYLCQRVMQERDLLVQFGRPLVRQDRDEHTRRDFRALVRDLWGELLGYERNEEVIEALRDVDLADADGSVTSQVAGCSGALYDLGWLPGQTADALDVWIAAVDAATGFAAGVRGG